MTIDPKLLGSAVIGAIFASLGYVAKLGFQEILSWRDTQAKRRAHLLELASLVRAAGAVFETEKNLAETLAARLKARFDVKSGGSLGTEATIAHFFDQLNGEEKTMHGIIRGYTENATRPLNLRLSKWLLDDVYFRAARHGGETARQLADSLNELDVHLTLWHAKYDVWMADSRHALVFMENEFQHGAAFPKELDVRVTKMVALFI
jgi:hypothetical protein